jgi:1-deoxyxylulose-5-phosphate synthase
MDFGADIGEKHVDRRSKHVPLPKVDDQAHAWAGDLLGQLVWSDGYQGGTSEEFVGRAISRFSHREDIVLATKVSGKMHDGPGGSGLSRKAILEQVDASLRRLGIDYIDVYYVHRFDPETPVEETMATLDGLVRAGKVRYLGASLDVGVAVREDAAHRRGERLDDVFGDAGPVQRPQAGRGAGHDPDVPGPGRRPDPVLPTGQGSRGPTLGRTDRTVVVGPMAQVALAWLLSKPVVACPIVGATKPNHLPDSVAAVDFNLTDAEITTLEERYTSQENYWW